MIKKKDHNIDPQPYDDYQKSLETQAAVADPPPAAWEDVPFELPAPSYARLLPEGVYKGVTVQHDLKRSSKGNSELDLVVRLTDREGDDGKLTPLPRPVRRTISWYFGSLKSGEIAVADLAFLGVPEVEDMNVLNPDNPDGVKLSGKEVFVSVQHEEFNSRVQDRCRLARRKVSTPEERQASVRAGQDVFAAVMRARKEKRQQY